MWAPAVSHGTPTIPLSDGVTWQVCGATSRGISLFARARATSSLPGPVASSASYGRSKPAAAMVYSGRPAHYRPFFSRHGSEPWERSLFCAALSGKQLASPVDSGLWGSDEKPRSELYLKAWTALARCSQPFGLLRAATLDVAPFAGSHVRGDAASRPLTERTLIDGAHVSFT